MKHASTTALQSIEPLLERIRQFEGIQEKKLGIFYRKSKAFLHFHEDGDRLFADVRLTGLDFDRLPCTTKREQDTLITAIGSVLK